MGRPTKENSLTRQDVVNAAIAFLLDFSDILLDSQSLSKTRLVDITRLVNLAIFGFISLEQSGLLTLPRSTDESFAIMLDALIEAIEYIKNN